MNRILFGRYFQKMQKYSFLGTLNEAILRLSIIAYDRHFIRKTFQSIAKEKNPQKWVFILGCYNSGTTLLQRLISGHPGVCSMPREGVRFTDALRTPEDLGWTRMWNECLDYMHKDLEKNQESVNKIMKDWSPWWRGSGGVFLEKSIANILRAEWLQKHFPTSYFIGITRNGYAASYGIVNKAKPRGEVQKKIGDRYPIEMAAREWAKANSLLLDYTETLTRYTRIRYEDLLEHPESTIKQLFEFLELNDCPVVETDTGVQINKKHFELWNGNDVSLKKLSDEDIRRIKPIIMPISRKYGYEDAF